MAGRFKLDQHIGQGAFGDVYSGHEVETNTPVAVKLERVGVKYPQLEYEARVYGALRGVPGIARMHYSGLEGDYNVMVIDRLGEDMETTRSNREGGRLAVSTVLKLARDCLHILQEFHARGFVHRDLKPDNLMWGRDGKGVHLIDFGLSKYMLDGDGRYITDQGGKSLTGTPRYASVANHRGREQGRRDDLESLGFVLVYLLTGSLPWQNEEDYDKIMRSKQQNLRTGNLVKDMHKFFRKYFEYVSTLRFHDEPNYSYLRGLSRK